MGRSLSSSSRLHEFARIAASGSVQGPKCFKPMPYDRGFLPSTNKSRVVPVTSDQSKTVMDNAEEGRQTRVPLSLVVSDCVKRWFQDTLVQAKAGDVAMQVLVSKMYYSGYGVPVDPFEGRAWMTRAFRYRSSVLNVSEKHPGNYVTHSESGEVKGDGKNEK